MVEASQAGDGIVFRNVDYACDIAGACLQTYADELSARLNLVFDLENSGVSEVSHMQPPHGTFIVAQMQGNPVGCVGIKGTGGTIAEVKRMWIAPAARGQGLARRMMATAEDAARGLGIKTLRLDTNRKLFEAVKMYENTGWREIARFNDDPYPDIFFEKAL